jgi:hypothetical protein
MKTYLLRAARPIARLSCLILVACSSSPGSGDNPDSGTNTGHDAAAGDAAGNDGPSNDAIAPDASADGPEGPADGAAPGNWGEPCTVGNDATCMSGLFCLQGPAGGTVGFCTKTCPATSSAVCPGTPAGMAAYCVVTTVDAQGDKGCAFVCLEPGHTWTCPGALKCETSDDPPGSGQRLCIP